MTDHAVSKRKQVEEALRESEARFRQIFEQAPIAIIREDWTDVRTAVDALRRGGVGDIKVHLETNPDEAKAILDMARVLDANETAARLYKSRDVAVFVAFNNTGGYTEDDLRAGIEMIAAFVAGDTQFQRETSQFTYDGSTIDTLITARIVLGCEDDWRTVIFTNLDMTERKRAEEALRESETALHERQSLLIQAAKIGGLGQWVWDVSEGEVSDITAQCASIFDATPETFSHEQFLQNLHPDDRSRCEHEWLAAIESRTVYDSEFRFIRSDGTMRVIHEVGDFLPDEDGGAGRYVGTSHDITEGKRAEEALRESEERLKKAQQIARVGNWDWDLETDIQRWSEESCRLIGLELDDNVFTADQFMSFVHRDDRGHLEAATCGTINRSIFCSRTWSCRAG